MSPVIDRRDFLKVVGIGTAATAAACSSRVPEKIIPHVIPPEDQIPGESLWYASTCQACGSACGITVRNREGRAIKIEGNSNNPINEGGLCTRGHSMLQGTYHPDRYRQPMVAGQPASWADAVKQVASVITPGKTVLLTGAIAVSTKQQVIADAVKALGIRHVIWEPVQTDPLATAAEIVLGKKQIPNFKFSEAGVVLSIGADFLETWLNPVRNQKQLSKRRRPGQQQITKVIHIEPRLSLTAANADEWLQLKPGTEVYFLAALVAHVVRSGKAKWNFSSDAQQVEDWLKGFPLDNVEQVTGVTQATIERIAQELMQYGPALVVAGGAAAQYSNATAVHAMSLILTKVLSGDQLMGFGAQSQKPQAVNLLTDFQALMKDIQAGNVETLLIHECDPVFTAANLKVKDALSNVKNLVVLDAMPTETSKLANAILPDHTMLEGWGDYFAYEGAFLLQQPAMNPLWDTMATADVLIALAKERGAVLAYESYSQAIELNWKNIHKQVGVGGAFESFWVETKRNGGYYGQVSTMPTQSAITELKRITLKETQREGNGKLNLLVYPHIYRYDGRFANRAWLQEIPDPLIQSVWSNWFEIHPKTAKELGIKQGDKVRITTTTGAIETFAYVTTGVAPEAIALPLGQGHTDAIGRYGSQIEGNPFELLAPIADDTTKAWVYGGNLADLQKVADADLELISAIDVNLVTTDGSKHDLGRGIAPIIALDQIKHAKHEEHHGTKITDPNGFYPPHDHPEHRWGMVVDVNACTGCGACVASCYSENNIPIVGKAKVSKGREMAWLRIERYYDSNDANNNVRFVPMFCQHCNNAPCEPVCPVIATYHTVDGLNGMVYNRCVGTRYCGNNCSYKVRRFNWFGYGEVDSPDYAWPEPMNLMLNPDVTVRTAGVMEKCTFCVQRIREATEIAKVNEQPLSNALTTACAQSCPTDALTFGDLKDPKSKVSQVAATDPRRYKILEVLNTQPAVTYLKKVHWVG